MQVEVQEKSRKRFELISNMNKEKKNSRLQWKSDSDNKNLK